MISGFANKAVKRKSGTIIKVTYLTLYFRASRIFSVLSFNFENVGNKTENNIEIVVLEAIFAKPIPLE